VVHQHERGLNWNGMRGYVTLTCFDCRYTAKAAQDELDNRRCPLCRKSLVNCGKQFRTPRHRDNKGWKCAERHVLQPRPSVVFRLGEKLVSFWVARRHDT
jgi:ssDNA-binding Zn-finger/Zn-ribbon topoisomerase 1